MTSPLPAVRVDSTAPAGIAGSPPMLAQADSSSEQQAATDQAGIRNVGRRMAHLHRGPVAIMRWRRQ
jgi:hypothetical protein